jgi:hypothetical protein
LWCIILAVMKNRNRNSGSGGITEAYDQCLYT